MENYSRYSKPSQARKQKLAEKLTGAPRPKRPYRKGSDRRAPKHTFIILGKNILHNKELSNRAKVVYAELSKWTGDKDGKEVKAGIEKIASNLGESEKTVKRGIKELQEAEFIKRTRRFGKSSLTKLFEPRNESGEKRQVAHLQNRKKAVDKGKPIREDNGDLTREDNGDLTVESEDAPSHQGKQDENEAPLRQVVSIKKSLTTGEPSSSSELFGSVNSKELNDKANDTLNINELIATLQTEALSEAGIIWEPTESKEKKEKGSDEKKEKKRGKLRGQVKDLRDKLGGSGEVVKFYKWYFQDPRRVNRFRNAPNKFKFWKVMDERTNYKTVQRESRESEKMRLEIDLTAPSTPYSREDLTGLSLEELEELEEDMREPVEENEQSMAEARAKMG